MRDGWLVRQYEFFFTFVVYGVVSTICCSIPASSHIPSNCQDYFCCESRPFLRVTGSEVIFCSHLHPPLHSSNSFRGFSQPEHDDRLFAWTECYSHIQHSWDISYCMDLIIIFVQKKKKKTSDCGNSAFWTYWNHISLPAKSHQCTFLYLYCILAYHGY
jgi:hypothetical protein